MCKNKASCQINEKGENYCICTHEYTGDLCEKKTGCHGNPCKHGKCKNDPEDPTKHTCKCDEGLVGPKCDISRTYSIKIAFKFLLIKFTVLKLFTFSKTKSKRMHA